MVRVQHTLYKDIEYTLIPLKSCISHAYAMAFNIRLLWFSKSLQTTSHDGIPAGNAPNRINDRNLIHLWSSRESWVETGVEWCSIRQLVQPTPPKTQQNKAKRFATPRFRCLPYSDNNNRLLVWLYSVLLRRTEIEWRDDTKKLCHTPEPYKLLSHSEVSFRRILGPKMRGQ